MPNLIRPQQNNSWTMICCCIYYDPSIFSCHTSFRITVLVYVDNIIITETGSGGVHHLQASLHSIFIWRILTLSSIFLGLKFTHLHKVFSINQHNYTKDLIALACLENSTPVDTPLEVNVKYHKADGDPLSNPTIYKKLVGSLVYLTITHPNISYAINLRLTNGTNIS